MLVTIYVNKFKDDGYDRYHSIQKYNGEYDNHPVIKDFSESLSHCFIETIDDTFDIFVVNTDIYNGQGSEILINYIQTFVREQNINDLIK